MTAASRRHLVDYAVKAHALSGNKACKMCRIGRSVYRYQPKKQVADTKIKKVLTDLAKVHHRWGFDKMMAKIKQNYAWNHKRVYRVYCELKLNLRIKPRKRVSPREAKMLVQPIVSNHCWSLDFMSDTLSNKRKFRTLNVIDDYNRECLLIEPAFSLPSMVVTRLLDQVAESKGYPEVIRSDNGPEFISSDFTKWAEQHNILLHHIQPGKPAQNGFIERFNRTYRQDILDAHWFYNLEEVREITEPWVDQYNNERPHESLANLSPINFKKMRDKTSEIPL
ncbi:IS3 family transposase [Piscirickettsia salmonis]|uniref:IS3 family transposase n=1 Tax=Piscirickettsia salmonis TaxID=1238 RepID=UPI0031F3B014